MTNPSGIGWKAGWTTRGETAEGDRADSCAELIRQCCLNFVVYLPVELYVYQRKCYSSPESLETIAHRGAAVKPGAERSTLRVNEGN